VLVESVAMVHSADDGPQLTGVRALIVEDDPLMAMDLEDILAGAGADVVGVCQTLDEAMARADTDDFAVAVLDFSLGADTATPVARRLVGRGVPFVVYTGNSQREPGLKEWKDYSIVEKPALPRTLVSAIRAALARR
jgi:DNA-binding response OmpR family regulator